MWPAADDETKKRARRRQILVYFNPAKTMTANEGLELVTLKIFENVVDEKTEKSWLHLFPELKRWYIVKKTIRRFEEESAIRRPYYEAWNVYLMYIKETDDVVPHKRLFL